MTTHSTTRRITMVERFFYPDSAPGALLTRGLAGHLAAAGHAVRVLAAQPSYRSVGQVGEAPRSETLDGAQVRRVPAIRERGPRWRQLLNYCAFPVQVGGRLLASRDDDAVVCNTVPPVVLPAIVALASRLRGQSFVYQCMDLHPEIGRLTGEFANPLVFRALRWIDTCSMRSAAAVVVLSEDMRRAVLARDPSLERNTVVINNFSPRADEAGMAPLPPAPDGVVRVVFTGNLGRFQGLETIVGAMAHLGPQDRVQLVLMGDGRARQQIAEQVADLSLPPGSEVTLLPHGSPGEARALMRSAHVGVVSLIPDLVRYAYPSKTATYAEQGLPMLVVCEGDSELAEMIRSEGLGWHAEPGDAAGVAAALRKASMDVATGRWQERSDRVAAYARDTFAPEAVMPRWVALVASLPPRDPLPLRARTLKRTVDIIGASVGLVLGAPVMAAGVAAATMETRRWGLFSQTRVGRYGAPFTVHKIRTMHPSDDERTVTVAGDPRITRSGVLMRRMKIDELPQLWDVLRGRMSLVGPRPDVPGWADKLTGEDRVLWHLRPGITCPASLTFRDEETILAKQADAEAYNREVIWPEKVRMNREYQRDWSLRMDLGCLLRTLLPG